MRLHVGHLDEEKYRASNYEDVVTEYEELMLDILALTERPNRSALEAAAKLAFTGVQASEKAMFAQQLHKAFKECRTKAKSVTSGAKTAASVLRVVKRLRDLGRSSATPLPVASGTAASSSADTTMDNAGILQQDVFAAMGVSPPKKVRRLAPRPSEALTVASSAPDLKEGATVAQFFEWEKRVAVRMHPGGRREEAKMSAGSNGFLVATWRDGAQEETECPTLLEDLATRKKPASAPKEETRAEATRSRACCCSPGIWGGGQFGGKLVASARFVQWKDRQNHARDGATEAPAQRLWNLQKSQGLHSVLLAEAGPSLIAQLRTKSKICFGG